jgi:Neocarzinostatin family
MALVVGGLVFFEQAAAFAAATIQVTPATGLVSGKTVTVVGSGLAGSAKGLVLECNEAPREPTVFVGPPFDMAEPVGCSAPSLKHIVTTSASGTLATTLVVREGRKLGPPCGFDPVDGACSNHRDSAGNKPGKDAQNYPCPPSPAQQVAGIGCAIVFIDTSQEQVSAPITFLEPLTPAPPGTTTPTVPGTTPTTKPTTPTTAPPPTPSTVPSTPPTTLPRTSPSSSPVPPVLPGSSPPAKTGTATSPSPGSVATSSGHLAFTGLGRSGKLLAALGGFLLLLGLVLLFSDVRRFLPWLLGR